MKAVKKIMFVIALILSFIMLTNAEEEEFASTTKYFKTDTYYNSLLPNSYNTNAISTSYEITEEEYENVDELTGNMASPNVSGSVETTYKKMTTSITKNGNYYRYKNVLLWKKFPSVRSYDIIGIGHFSTVKVHGSAHFEEYYCFTSGSCYTNIAHYTQTFNTGSGASFPLPTGSLTTLKTTFYFDVEKNTTLTIISQDAYGDYSHAITNVTLANSKKYTVNPTGISLDGSIINSYDSITSTIVTLNATW